MSETDDVNSRADWSVDVDLSPIPEAEARPPLTTEKIVHEPDTRHEVRPPMREAPPYSAIHLLRLQWPGEEPRVGTAWAVSPRTLITAGHNLVRPGGSTSGVRVFRRDTQMWIAPAKARTVEGWLQSDGTDHRFDYGALLMPEGIVLPQPYLDLAVLPGRGIPVMVAGFPFDKPGGTLWQATGLVVEFDELLRYDVDTESGQSGAPVLGRFDGRVVAVGVHVDRDPVRPLNVGVRLDSNKIATINSWKA